MSSDRLSRSTQTTPHTLHIMPLRLLLRWTRRGLLVLAVTLTALLLTILVAYARKDIARRGFLVDPDWEPPGRLVAGNELRFSGRGAAAQSRLLDDAENEKPRPSLTMRTYGNNFSMEGLRPLHFVKLDEADQRVFPTAYLVTPTYERLTQLADLLRLCYTIMHVPKVHWIVVEDRHSRSQLVTDLLHGCQTPTLIKTHLFVKTSNATPHRGIPQRNAGIDWLRRNVKRGVNVTSGGVYFADDDNTYDVRVFESVRWTLKVSVWLVGFAGGASFEGFRCREGAVGAWQGRFGPNRPFPLDMAGFAVGLDFLLQRPSARFTLQSKKGYIESDFLQSLHITRKDLKPGFADPRCRQIMAYHTKTNKPRVKEPTLRDKNIVKVSNWSAVKKAPFLMQKMAALQRPAQKEAGNIETLGHVPSKLQENVRPNLKGKIPAKGSVKVPAKLPVKVPAKLPVKVPAKLPVKVLAKLPVKVPAN